MEIVCIAQSLCCATSLFPRSAMEHEFIVFELATERKSPEAISVLVTEHLVQEHQAAAGAP